jgi:hypothetical protein
MEVVAKKNGEQIERDPYDLDYIQLDVVQDVVRTLEPLETNPEARVEVDLGEDNTPRYNLVNCNPDFKNRFFQIIESRGQVNY